MSNRKAPMPAARTSGTPIALPEVNDLLDGIADAARVSFGAESISIARVDEAAGELDYLVASGRGAEQVIGMRLPLGRGLAGYCAAAAATVAIDDVASDPRFARDVAERIGYVPRSMLVAPVVRGDEVLGVLSVLDRTQPAGAAALDLAGRFARACEGALTLAAAVEARAIGSVEADAAARLLDDFLAYAASHRDAGRAPE